MPKADPLSVRCPKCDAGPGAKCRNYKGRACAPHSDRNRAVKHVPKVEPIEQIQGRVDTRSAVRKAALLEWMQAVSKCGPNATAYGKWVLIDRARERPDVVVYCCRRPTSQGWLPRYEDLVPDHNEEMPIPYCLYGGRGQVIGPGYRWEVRMVTIDVPEVTSAEELHAAAEKRRAKALGKNAQADAELAAWKARNVAPSLFDLTPDEVPES